MLRGLFGWAAAVGASMDLYGSLLDDQDGCRGCIHSAIATELIVCFRVASHMLAFVLFLLASCRMVGPQ